MKISLIDSVAGVRKDLALNTELPVDLKAGDYSGRFFLKFAPGVATTVNRHAEEDPGIIEATANGGILRLKITGVEGYAGSLRIYDLTGRMLHEQAVREPGYYDYPGLRSNGIYIVTYRTGSVAASRKVALLK
jgi:hypothetical protein